MRHSVSVFPRIRRDQVSQDELGWDRRITDKNEILNSLWK